MVGGPVLYIGTIGGCVPSWVAPRPTCATSTTTAMPTTIRRRTPGFAPAPDSLTARPSRPQGRKQSAERKEGATIGHEPVNTHPARVAGRCLHGAAAWLTWTRTAACWPWTRCTAACSKISRGGVAQCNQARETIRAERPRHSGRAATQNGGLDGSKTK